MSPPGRCPSSVAGEGDAGGGNLDPPGLQRRIEYHLILNDPVIVMGIFFLHTPPLLKDGAIDELMQNWAARPQSAGDPLFADHEDLYNTINVTEIGHVPWESFEVTYDQPIPPGDTTSWKTKVYAVHFRDLHKVLQNQLANPDFKLDIDFALKQKLMKAITRPTMPAEISSGLKDRIVKWCFEDDYTVQQITNLAGVSLGLISNTIALHRQYGQVTNPFCNRFGRPRILNDGDLAYLAEILRVSISVIGQALVEMDLSRKKLKKTATERDEQLRTVWEAEMAQYTDPDVFVALDESAVDNKTVQRSHGQSITGTPCIQRATFI
ncbi:hypothetical protein B0H10DRAFT_2214249 [Mycena sp. CBHHK59/15]|nr:hypothetical protein B0H10DRAFT_2214249 [Mycena sp. CBHHK59/15]